MNTGAKTFAGSKGLRALLALCLLSPLLMGGCPEFRNDVVGVLETATRSVLFGSEDAWTIADTARLSFADAALDLLFDQLRGDQNQ